MKIDTDIITKEYNVSRKAVLSSKLLNTVYAAQDRNINSEFPYTALINNKSNTFIKNTKFINNVRNPNEKNIIILNTNQSNLNGKNVTLQGSLNTTFVVNTKNSQSTIKCNELNYNTVLNARNDNQSFFNFPAPTDTKDFTVQPMMISNGQRTIWSESKYGWINKDVTFTDFINSVVHDLNGQDLEFTLDSDENLRSLQNYHNGSIIINGNGKQYNNLTISDNSIKLVLKNFNFYNLIVRNCQSLYLEDCNFLNSNGLISEVVNLDDYSPWKFKQGDFSLLYDFCCLRSENSKIFITNENRNLVFQNFLLGIHANNNSQIFIYSNVSYTNNNSSKGVAILKENLRSFRLKDFRPVFLVASNGSRIFCSYGTNDNPLSAVFTYPPNFDGYRPNTSTATGSRDDSFIIENNEYQNRDRKNWRRAKSCIVSLFEQVNNSEVNISFNKKVETQFSQSNSISVPLFGLYQMAKPHLNNETSVIANRWILPNNYIHILSGTKNEHLTGRIIDENNNEVKNDQYQLNVIRNNEMELCPTIYFHSYGSPSCSVNPMSLGTFPYLGSQPHLHHYFLETPIEYTESRSSHKVSLDLEEKYFYKQNIKNISSIRSDELKFLLYNNEATSDPVKEIKLVDSIDSNTTSIFYNPLKSNFYSYNNSTNVETDENDKIFPYLYVYFKAKKKDSELDLSILFRDCIRIKVNGSTRNVWLQTRQVSGEQYERKYYFYLDSNWKKIYINTKGFAIFIQKDLNQNNIVIDKYFYIDRTNQKVEITKKPKVINLIESYKRYVYIKKLKLNIFYDRSNNQFYYEKGTVKCYDKDSYIKTNLIYRFKNTQNLQSLINDFDPVTRTRTQLTTTNGKQVRYKAKRGFYRSVNGQWVNYNQNHIIVIYDDNSKQLSYHFITSDKKNEDITNFVNRSRQYINYNVSNNNTVKVYYNSIFGFHYYDSNNNDERVKIDIDSTLLTSQVGGKVNYYLVNHDVDITNMMTGNHDCFSSFIDDINRLVFFNTQNQEFYYISDIDVGNKVYITNNLDLAKKYTFVDTTKVNITNLYKSLSNTCSAWINKNWNPKEENVRIDLYYERYTPPEGESMPEQEPIGNFYYLEVDSSTEPPTSTKIYVNDNIEINYSDNNAVSSVYYYQKLPVDITDVMIDSFYTTLENGEMREIFYNGQGEFFYFDEEQNKIDVTNYIISKLKISYNDNGSIIDLTSVFTNPNKISKKIFLIEGDTSVEHDIYYDNSNNIFYYKEETELANINNKINNSTGERIYDGEINVEYLYINCFTKTEDGVDINVYYDKNEDMFYSLNNDSFTDLTNEIKNELTYIYNNININNVIKNANITFETIIDGQTCIINYDQTTQKFISNGSVDVTDIIKEKMVYLYNNVDISEVMEGDKYFTTTVEINGIQKERDIYYSPKRNIFYLDKHDCTDEFTNLKYQCDNTDITQIINGTQITFRGSYLVNEMDQEDDPENPITEEEKEEIKNPKDKLIIYNSFTKEFFLDDVNDTGDNITEYIKPLIQTDIRVKNNKIDITNISQFDVITEEGEYKTIHYDDVTSKYYLNEAVDISATDDLSSYIQYIFKNEENIQDDITDIINHTGERTYFSYLGENIYFDDKYGFYYNIPSSEETDPEPEEDDIIVYEDDDEIQDDTKVDFNSEILDQLQIYLSEKYLDVTNLMKDSNKSIKIKIDSTDTNLQNRKIDLKFNNTLGFYFKLTNSQNMSINEFILPLLYVLKNGEYIKFVDYKKEENKNYEFKVTDYNTNVDEYFIYLVPERDENNDVSIVANLVDVILNNQIFTLGLDNGEIRDIAFSYNNIKQDYFYTSDKNYFSDEWTINHINSISDRKFYICDLKLSEIINSYSLQIQVLQDTYYDYVEKNFIRKNNNGSFTDISDQVTPFIDIINNEKYYYGSLIDITNNNIRQSFQPVTNKLSGKPVYYDAFGGKKLNGIFYSYIGSNNTTYEYKTTDNAIKSNLEIKYFYNNENITNAISGIGFEVSGVQVYYNKDTGIYYRYNGQKAEKFTKHISESTINKDVALACCFHGKHNVSKKSTFYAVIDGKFRKVVGTKSGDDFTYKYDKVSKSNATNVVNNNTSSKDGQIFYKNPDLKNVIFDGGSWFNTPIDGITRNVKYETKTNMFYYKAGTKVDVTKKIRSKLFYSYKKEDINDVVKGVGFITDFRNKILNGREREVFYDNINNSYYFYQKKNLTEGNVKDYAVVDITNVQLYPNKWSFLAYLPKETGKKYREIFYNNNLGYYYIQGKKNVSLMKDDVEGENIVKIQGKTYYHNNYVSNYLIEEGFLLVNINGEIKEAYYDQSKNQWYYIQYKKDVTQLIDSLISKSYFYKGSSFKLSDVSIVSSNNKTVNVFSSFITTENENSIKQIKYNLENGFYYTKSSTNHRVNAEINGKMSYYFKDNSTKTQKDITNLFYTDNLDKATFTTTIDGRNRDIYYTNIKDHFNLSKSEFYYKNGNNKVNVTDKILSAVICRYDYKNIDYLIEDGNNYFITVYKPNNSLTATWKKIYVYYNNNKWYFYNNKDTQKDITTQITSNIITLNEKKYYSYSTTITNLMNDTKAQRKIMLASIPVNVYYDHSTKDFYYYEDEQENRSQRVTITQNILPNVYKEQYYNNNGRLLKVFSDGERILNSINITIDGEEKSAVWDDDERCFIYDTYGDAIIDGSFLNSMHNSVEMICSNTNNNKNLTDVVNITNTKLYQSVYRLKE